MITHRYEAMLHLCYILSHSSFSGFCWSFMNSATASVRLSDACAIHEADDKGTHSRGFVVVTRRPTFLISFEVLDEALEGIASTAAQGDSGSRGFLHRCCVWGSVPHSGVAMATAIVFLWTEIGVGIGECKLDVSRVEAHPGSFRSTQLVVFGGT